MLMLILPVVIVAVLFVVFIISRYQVVPSNLALIVSGSFLGNKNVHTDEDGNKVKILINGGTFVLPILQKSRTLNRSSMKLDISTPEVYTQQGVPVMATGTVIVKFGSRVEELATAAEQYLGKSEDEIESESREVLEGHLRAILGTMTVEEIYQDRDRFAENVQSQASTDLNKMGLKIISFTIKDISDKNGYLDSLGKPQIAIVKRNAEIAEAEALKDTRIKKAQAEQEAQEQEIVRQTQIAEQQKIKDIKIAEYQRDSEVATAQAEQIAVAERKQVEIIEKEKNILLEEKEIEIAEKRYDVEFKKKADANLYVQQKEADAKKYAEIAEAEANAEVTKLKAEADAESVQKATVASADNIAQLGQAEADKIAKIGQAEAESKALMANALAKLDEVGQAQSIIAILPELFKAINDPIGNIDKIVSFGGDNGVSDMSQAGLARTLETVKETTGLDLVGVLNQSLGNKQIVQAIEDNSSEEK